MDALLIVMATLPESPIGFAGLAIVVLIAVVVGLVLRKRDGR